jgi:HSP20 family molecular chaperone IbpA
MAEQELTPREKQEIKEADQVRPGRSYMPDVDIREDEKSLYLWADVPGVKQDSIHVDLDDGVLTIRGDVSIADYEGLSPIYTEYNVGNFLRRFTLPANSRFDIDAITARVSTGVLHVEIPKSQQARQRRIPVAAA